MSASRRPLGRLKVRLFLWFSAAILLAITASGALVALARPDPSERPLRLVARTIAAQLAERWPDPAACDAYLARARELVGVECALERDPSRWPRSVHRVARRGGFLAFDADGDAYVPIVRGGALVGAVRFEGLGPRPPVWRFAVALVTGAIVLAWAASRVAKQLADPLEHLAKVAEALGAGNLKTRTGIDEKREVSQEVRDLANAMDAMAARLERLVREQRELLAAISHELRSPLTRARLALEIARDRSASAAPLANELDRVETNLTEVEAILADLLTSSRAGLSDLRRERVDLVRWVASRVAEEPTTPPIVVEAAAGPLWIEADLALLGRALHNVLANARAHARPEAREAPIVVAVARADDGATARVAVRDQGGGFPADVLPRAFEAFVRGDAARTPGAGSGLGLTIVRRVAEAHGGDVTARNVVRDGIPIGAELILALPLALDQLAGDGGGR